MPNLESRAAGRRSPKGASLGSLIFSQVWPHYNSTFQIGVSTFDIISQVLVPGFSMSNYFPSIKRADWDQKYAAAKELMQSRLSIPKVLIEVGAQHPLVRGTEPGEEFSARLLLAKKLFEEKTTQGLHVEIYVPGSRHMHQGVADTVSLARAGVMFLEQQGLPKENLHGPDLNERYKGDQGVYNSADECFVSASYFQDENFGQFLCVLSPVQMYRKALHHIWFGVLPLFYTAPTLNTFHNYINEVYDAIPGVRDIDPNLQSADSFFGKESRKNRRPQDGLPIN
jgi:hypothetical protein